MREGGRLDHVCDRAGPHAQDLEELGRDDGEFLDDGFTDQDSVFGDTEANFVLSQMQNKFTVSHANYYATPHVDLDASAYRLVETLDLDVREGSEMAVNIEMYKDYPSAASFPEYDVGLPGYNYHLVKKRLMSLSSPDLCEVSESGSVLDRIRHSRLWRWGREFRRR